MTKQNLEQARALATQAREWLSTPEGSKQLSDADNRATQTTKELEKDRRIDPRQLSEPFTV
mgnify:CR=1 FL=1